MPKPCVYAGDPSCPHGACSHKEKERYMWKFQNTMQVLLRKNIVNLHLLVEFAPYAKNIPFLYVREMG